jgi:hypothetical protein
MSQCEACNQSIRGDYHLSGFIGSFDYTVPNFCHGCGAAYPWMSEKLEAAGELVRESDLTQTEKETFAASLDDIVRDTPKTELASSRVRRLLDKAGPEVGGALKTIVVQIATSAAKQQIGLP